MFYVQCAMVNVQLYLNVQLYQMSGNSWCQSDNGIWSIVLDCKRGQLRKMVGEIECQVVMMINHDNLDANDNEG